MKAQQPVQNIFYSNAATLQLNQFKKGCLDNIMFWLRFSGSKQIFGGHEAAFHDQPECKFVKCTKCRK